KVRSSWAVISGTNALALSSDGRKLVTGGAGAVLQWDADGGAEQVPLPGHAGELLSVALAPDSRILATAGGRRRCRPVGHEHGGRTVSASRAGRPADLFPGVRPRRPAPRRGPGGRLAAALGNGGPNRRVLAPRQLGGPPRLLGTTGQLRGRRPG